MQAKRFSNLPGRPLILFQSNRTRSPCASGQREAACQEGVEASHLTRHCAPVQDALAQQVRPRAGRSRGFPIFSSTHRDLLRGHDKLLEKRRSCLAARVERVPEDDGDLLLCGRSNPYQAAASGVRPSSSG